MTTGESPPPDPPPSSLSGAWTLGKVVLGAALIALGCWRVGVIALGPDEALLFGYRVRTASAANQARMLKELNREVMDLTRTVPDLGERSDRILALHREHEARLAEQADLDRRGYRTQRRMELFVVLFAFVTGPGLAASGRNVLWGRKEGGPPGPAAPPPAAPAA